MSEWSHTSSGEEGVGEEEMGLVSVSGHEEITDQSHPLLFHFQHLTSSAHAPDSGGPWRRDIAHSPDLLSLEHERQLDENNATHRRDATSRSVSLSAISQPRPTPYGNSVAPSPPSRLVSVGDDEDDDMFLVNMSVSNKSMDTPPDNDGCETSFNTAIITSVASRDAGTQVPDAMTVVVTIDPDFEEEGKMDALHPGIKLMSPPPGRKVCTGAGGLPLQSILRPPSEVRKSGGSGAHFQSTPTEIDRRKTLAGSAIRDVRDSRSLLPLLEKQPGLLNRRVSLPAKQLFLQNTPQRKPSKTFTVINYGNIGKEASTTMPTGREPIALMELLEVDDKTEEEDMLESTNIQSIHRLLSRQPSEDVTVTGDSDCQSVIDMTPPVSSRRKRLLSIQHIHPSNKSAPNNDISDVHDTTDFKTSNACITVTSDLSAQKTYDGSRRKKDPQVLALAEYGKQFAKRKKNRLIQKDGSINIRPANISKRNFQFLRDIFTTLLDLSWWWVWAVFTLAFVLSWFGFAAIWWFVAFSHGDLEQPIDSEKPPKCVIGIEDFGSALLFSIETQHTIGYGTRAIHTVCPPSFVVLMAQSLIGVVIQCVMAGVVFAKLAKPKYRAETIMFSKRAVICLEDGQYCLVFRVGDMRRSQLVGCTLHAFLVRDHMNKDGRKTQFQRRHLDVVSESEDYDQYMFLAWPTKIIHRITPDSPLWEVCKETLLEEQFEIIVVLEGTIESSGMTTQIRTSYLPSEIEWGQGFLNLLTEQTSGRAVEIDYSNFSITEGRAGMPDHSAQEHNHQMALLLGANNNNNNTILPHTLQAQPRDARSLRRASTMSSVCFYRC